MLLGDYPPPLGGGADSRGHRRFALFLGEQDYGAHSIETKTIGYTKMSSECKNYRCDPQATPMEAGFGENGSDAADAW